MAYVYQINSEKGKQEADKLGVGQSYKASDGSTWTKNNDGSISVTTKSGNTYSSNYTGNSGTSKPSSSSGSSSSKKPTNSSTSNTATQTTNRYNTVVYDPSGKEQQGYIENGITYLSDGSRIGEGYTSKDASGRYWTVTNGKGVENKNFSPVTNAYNQQYESTQTTTKPKYTGPQYVQRDGMNIDMNQDYKALMEQYANDPQALKILEEARNAKIAILQEYGANDYGGQTYDHADVKLGNYDDSAYNAYVAQQNKLKNGEISAAQSNANVSLSELDAVAKELGLQNVDELRNLWVNSQLEQKALEEVLAARGITGGGAETAALDLDSAYRRNYADQIGRYNSRIAEIAQQRAGVETDLATTINAIRNTYGQNTADAYYQNLQNKAQADSEARAALLKQLGLA